MEREPDCIFCGHEIETVVHCDSSGRNPLCTRCNEVRKIIDDTELDFDKWILSYKSWRFDT